MRVILGVWTYIYRNLLQLLVWFLLLVFGFGFGFLFACLFPFIGFFFLCCVIFFPWFNGLVPVLRHPWSVISWDNKSSVFHYYLDYQQEVASVCALGWCCCSSPSLSECTTVSCFLVGCWTETLSSSTCLPHELSQTGQCLSC